MHIQDVVNTSNMETMYGKIRDWEVKIDYVCTVISVHKSFTTSMENITEVKISHRRQFNWSWTFYFFSGVFLPRHVSVYLCQYLYERWFLTKFQTKIVWKREMSWIWTIWKILDVMWLKVEMSWDKLFFILFNESD